MMRRWAIATLPLLVAVGCEAPHDSVNSIITRQTRALEKLPSEERARMLTTAEPIDPVSAETVLEPGLLDRDRARQIALRANPDIHVARARLEAALARIGEARSYYFPQIEAAHNSTRTLQTPNRLTRYPTSFLSTQAIPTIPPNPTIADLVNAVTGLNSRLYPEVKISTGNTNSFSEHSSALSASWTIFDGFVREARLLSSKHSYLASAMAVADAERLLVQAVDNAYYQWQLGREEIRIAGADEAFSQEQLADAQRKFEAQRVTKAVVLNFEVRVRAAQASVVAAQGLQDTAEVVLAELLALPDLQIPDDVALAPLKEETSAELTAPISDEWVASALDARPDLAQAEHIAKAREENILMAKGQFSPELAVRGSWGFEKGSTIEYSVDDQSSAIGVELRWLISAGGLRTSQLRRARAEWWEAAAALKRKRLEVVGDVRKAVVDVVNAQEQVKLQRLNLLSARENRRIVQTEYASGKASLVRLNEAQRDYVETDAELTRSRIRLRQAWSALHAAAAAYRVEPGTPDEESQG